MDIWQKLKNTRRPIVVYGMGNGAERIADALKMYGKAPDGFFASDDFVRGQSFFGKRVMTFGEAKENFPDMIVLVGFGSQRREVIDRILNLDAEVYAPDVPVAGDTLFNEEFYKTHKIEFDTVREHLADEKSKQVFDEICAFKLDGNISHLTGCESGFDEMMSLLNITDAENYLDLGAFNGDTVLEFIKRAKSWDKITALEPDARNFRKLKANTENFGNVTCLNSAVSNECKQVHFLSRGGRNGRMSDSGAAVDAVSIDSLNQPFSLIKMDVEGAELDALSGGAETIKKFRPKMLVSAYHRSEDIFTLPLKVLEIQPAYKIYMRHLPCIPAWDTNYIFV